MTVKPTIETTADQPGSVQRLVRCVCGSATFYRNYRASGWWGQIVEIQKDVGVKVSESFTDNIRSGHEPKTMRCTDCGKRVANPDANISNDKAEPQPEKL
jgi:hypothetical protein